MVYDNGRVYEGQWFNNKISGIGYEKSKTGETYLGKFEDGKTNGFMLYTNDKTRESYIGIILGK